MTTMIKPSALTAWRDVAPRLAGAPPVSVVVPIHDGAPALRRCLDALVAHTPEAELVLVDDRSTDAAVGTLCARVLDRRPDARLVVQRQSTGFAGAINAGIRAAAPGRDVVLLNSDTVVTAGWLRKLRTAAHAEAGVATACPLSNAAGVFSVGAAHGDAPLPAGLSPARANRALEDASERVYEPAPATSAFCLYVRRAALDEAGLLDDRLFLRGYGEDNDVCERIATAGGRHVVDDATFVAHERAGSFGAAKAGLKRTNGQVLKALHPEHHARLGMWEQRSRLDETRARYARALAGDLGEVETELVVVGSGAEVVRGTWAGGRRRLVVTLGRGHALVDVFGRDGLCLELEEELRGALVAWLVNRWVVHRLTMRPGLLATSDLGAIRRAWELTA
jgi:GT2 family glycosyltransferase